MDALTHINWVDILILIIVLRTSYVSFKEGLSHELFPLLGSIVMVVASIGYYSRLGSFFTENIAKIPAELANFLAFIILVVVSGIIFKLFKILVDFVIKVEWNPSVERLGGGICGVFRAFVAASLILMILSMIPLPYLQKSIRDRSLTGRYVMGIGPYIYEKIAYVIPGIKASGSSAKHGEIMNRLEADKTIDVNGAAGEKSRKAEWEKAIEI